MNQWVLLSSLIILLLVTQSDAALRQRLSRRQSNEDSGPESTTASSAQSQDATQSPPRLYPDLPRPPTVAFVPPFGAPNNGPNGPPSFVPYGLQMPNNRFGEPPFRPMQPRPMTPSERLQSQTFTSGLGRKLLSLMGIGSSTNETIPNNEGSPTMEPQSNRNNNSSLDETMRALRNSTVLRQLNGGVQSVYGSLSRMYNSTVQQQLDLLQERYMKEASNSTDPWQQRMAQQVPQFFRSMAMKVNEAQENLNRVWRQVLKANNNTNNGGPISDRAASQMNTRSANSFDPMTGNAPIMGGNDGGNFLNHIGRSFGFGPDPMDDPLNPRQDMVSRLMDFWHNQVQPQMGMVRGQMTRIWRDLTSSGALRPGMQMGGRGGGNDMGSHNRNTSTDIVDDVLRDIETNEPEFKLIDSKTGTEQTPPMIPPRVQNGVVAMQRELNQLWNGLTNSIMNAMNTMSARRRSMNGGGGQMGNSNPEMDPAENEISDKIKELSKIQKDADVVFDTVQRQQQQQQAQQRPTFTDRFMNFFGNMDLGNMGDQLGNRFGESVSRFGNVLGDMWN